MKIINNITEKLSDELKQDLRAGSRLSIAAACFSVYAFEELKTQLLQIDALRFIFTSPTFLAEQPKQEQREFYIPRRNREKALHGSEFEIRLRNAFTQRAISKECADWIRQKTVFKSNSTDEQMPGFLTVDGDALSAYAPISGFTRAELGCERGGNMFSMINKIEAPESKAYLTLFDQLWADRRKMKDVTEQVLERITTAYRENSPEFLYFFALYHIFSDFLTNVSADDLPNDTNGFRESKVWNKLYTFQKDAVLAIISKLEQYNGCILADSVGLGKTFTALAVIKYYENRNLRVLVLCPKKLADNWTTYKANYVNNPIAADRLRYDSENERKFAGELDISEKVAVYVKLPSSFFISTPVGHYNPDWAIAFTEGSVRHIFFVAETKGNTDSLELRGVENAKIECARRHFAAISNEEVVYEVVDSFEKLMQKVI